MRTRSKLFMAGLIALGMISCNKENSSINDNEREEQVFMQVCIEMPDTRSATDGPNEGDSNSNANSDVEEGTAVESAINEVQMFLLDPVTKDVVATSVTDPNAIVKAKNMVTVPFRAQELIAYVEGGKNDIEAVIYVNNVPMTPEGAPQYDVDGTHRVVIDPQDQLDITGDGGFWMTNANRNHIVTTLPDLPLLLKHNDAGNPFTINPIDVERTAARFDVAAAAVDNTFPVMHDGTATLNVVMDEVALFNMSNEFYRLRRVSDNGDNPDFTQAANYEYLFGIETPINYVVDVPEAAETYSYVTVDQLKWKALSEIAVEANQDQWTGSDAAARPEYYTWRYATENTSKLGKNARQDKSTGVAYKGHIAVIEGTTESTLAAEINAGTATLYTLNNVLWGSWTRIAAQAARTDAIDQTLVDAYKFAKALLDDVNWKPELSGLAREMEAADAAGFIAYSPTNGKYEVYYNYYNRHNDKVSSGDTDPMPMKYGVVRNNVYKLKVSSVSVLGTPEWKQPEDKPIESEEVFFQVTVTILPWTVRINDIEF